jgi:hypothetical protein
VQVAPFEEGDRGKVTREPREEKNAPLGGLVGDATAAVGASRRGAAPAMVENGRATRSRCGQLRITMLFSEAGADSHAEVRAGAHDVAHPYQTHRPFPVDNRQVVDPVLGHQQLGGVECRVL